MIVQTVLEPTAPLVSVLVITYNSAAYIGRCFAALAQQTFDNFEVVVVDNASADGPPAMPTDPRFRLIASPTNLGFAAGNNLAARSARGGWIATLNPDAFPEPGWLAALFAETKRGPRIGMVGSLQKSADAPDILDGAGDCYHVVGVAWRGFHGAPISNAPPTGIAFGPCAAAALYRKDLFLKLGGFDERFFCYHEDVDLAFRMRLVGAECIQSADAIVAHIGSASTGRRSAFSVYYGSRNRIWTFAKNMPLCLLLIFGLPHILVNLCLLMRAILQGVAIPTAKGMWDGVRGLRDIWRTRRVVQRTRTVPVAAIAGAMTWSPRALVLRSGDVRELREGVPL